MEAIKISALRASYEKIGFRRQCRGTKQEIIQNLAEFKASLSSSIIKNKTKSEKSCQKILVCQCPFDDIVKALLNERGMPLTKDGLIARKLGDHALFETVGIKYNGTKEEYSYLLN